MAELHQIASDTDLYPVFTTGKKLNKKAFPGKSKVTPDHAVLVAGVVRGDLTPSQLDHLMDRMNKVKRVFKSRVEHHAQNLCVQYARKIGMKIGKNGDPVQSYSDIVEELESNPKMESFQNWYSIYYEQFEKSSGGKKDAEYNIMSELKVRYHDNTMTGGCVGELLNEVISKLLETMQKRSKEKQGLRLTKSRPGAEKEKDGSARNRRTKGDYFIIRSDPSHKMIDWHFFNVSMVRSIPCCDFLRRCYD
jgi:hypothetical protein